MARLTSKQRKALPDSAFAGPGRSYPVEDASHARNALARGSQHASPALLAKLKAKVASRYPNIQQKGKKKMVTKRHRKVKVKR